MKEIAIVIYILRLTNTIELKQEIIVMKAFSK